MRSVVFIKIESMKIRLPNIVIGNVKKDVINFIFNWKRIIVIIIKIKVNIITFSFSVTNFVTIFVAKSLLILNNLLKLDIKTSKPRINNANGRKFRIKILKLILKIP